MHLFLESGLVSGTHHFVRYPNGRMLAHQRVASRGDLLNCLLPSGVFLVFPAMDA